MENKFDCTIPQSQLKHSPLLTLVYVTYLKEILLKLFKEFFKNVKYCGNLCEENMECTVFIHHKYINFLFF